MSEQQYRCLVAHMNHWDLGIDIAMSDCQITISRQEVVSELWKAGWDYDEQLDSLEYNGQ